MWDLIRVEARVKTLPDIQEALDQLREMPFLDLDRSSSGRSVSVTQCGNG